MIKRAELVSFFGLGLLFCFIPLVGYAHIESASIITLISCLILVFRKESEPGFFRFRFLLPYIAFIPLFIKTTIFGCFSFDGLAFWIFIPIPAQILTHSIRGVIKRFFRFDRALTFCVFLLLTIIFPLIEIKNTPIVYLYNSIWGFWPGPIYDEQIVFPIQLIIHRFYVVVWAFLLYELAQPKVQIKRIIIPFLAVCSLFISFRPLGIIRTTKEVARSFDQNKSLGLINLYYNLQFTDSLDASFYLKEVQYHLNDLQTQLQVEIKAPIFIFLYDDPWQKKEIVGAKFTQYTPVWLSSFQIHVDRTSFESVIRHELVHLISKVKANSILGANWNMGITEGLATAFDPDISTQSTLHEFVAAGGIPPLKTMESLFSFTGFYAQSSSNAYYKTGSFIQFLAQKYPVSNVMDWYGGQDFEDVYSFPLDSAITYWQSFLSLQEVDSVQKRQSEQIFARPSLFEKDCPRMIKPEYQIWDNAQKAITRNQTKQYELLLRKGMLTEDEAWKQQFTYSFAIELMQTEKADSAIILMNSLPNSKQKSSLVFDAAVLSGNSSLKDSLWQNLSPAHKKFTEGKLAEEYVSIRFKEEMTSKPNILFLPFVFNLLGSKKEAQIPANLEELLIHHQIEFDYLRSYLAGVKNLVKRGKKEEALGFLTRLELKSSKAQHRYLIQRAIFEAQSM